MEWPIATGVAGFQSARATAVHPFERVRIEGTFRGKRVALVRRYHNDVEWPVAQVPLDPPLDLGLDMHSSSLAVQRFDGGIGHVHLDQEYAVSVDSIVRARSLFEGGLADRIYALHCGCTSPVVTDAMVEVPGEWSTASVSSAVDLAEMMEQARDRIPPPAGLAAHVAAWAGFASRIGATFGRTPLRISGALDGFSLSAAARRVGVGEFELVLGLEASQGLGIGLLASPTRPILDSLHVFFGGQDVHVGDAVFDEAFRIQVGREHEDAIRYALDATTRTLLLGVRDSGARLTLHDDGVRAAFTPSAAPTALPEAAAPLAEALTRIERELRLGGRSTSPYR